MGFAGLVTYLATMARDTRRVPIRTIHWCTLFAKPTPLQEAAFKLLNLEPIRVD
jgi:hypothetical protein